MRHARLQIPLDAVVMTRTIRTYSAILHVRPRRVSPYLTTPTPQFFKNKTYTCPQHDTAHRNVWYVPPMTSSIATSPTKFRAILPSWGLGSGCYSVINTGIRYLRVRIHALLLGESPQHRFQFPWAVDRYLRWPQQNSLRVEWTEQEAGTGGVGRIRPYTVSTRR